MQGKNVGVIYSAAHLLSTIVVEIEKSENAGACAHGILNSFEM